MSRSAACQVLRPHHGLRVTATRALSWPLSLPVVTTHKHSSEELLEPSRTTIGAEVHEGCVAVVRLLGKDDQIEPPKNCCVASLQEQVKDWLACYDNPTLS